MTSKVINIKNNSNSSPTFQETIINQNILRILVIGSVYTTVEIISLILSELGVFQSSISFYVSIIVLFHLIYLPTTSLLLTISIIFLETSLITTSPKRWP